MKSGKKIIPSTALVTLSAVVAFEAAAVTSTASMHAVVVQTPISVTEALKFDFGSLALSGAGSVVVQPGGGTSATAATVVGSVQPGKFNVTMAGGTKISVGSGTATVTIKNGSDTMSVGNFRFQCATGFSGHTSATGQAIATCTDITATSSGSGSIRVGGTLTFSGAESQGTYTGTFTVDVSYRYC